MTDQSNQSKVIQAIEANIGTLYVYGLYPGTKKEKDNVTVQFAKGVENSSTDELVRIAQKIERPSLRTGVFPPFRRDVIQEMLAKAGITITDEQFAAAKASDERILFHDEMEKAISAAELLGEDIAARLDIELTESLTPNPLSADPQRAIVVNPSTGVPKSVVDPYTGETYDFFYRHTRVVLKKSADMPTLDQTIDDYFRLDHEGKTPRELPADIVAQQMQRKAAEVLAGVGEKDLPA